MLGPHALHSTLACSGGCRIKRNGFIYMGSWAFSTQMCAHSICVLTRHKHLHSQKKNVCLLSQAHTVHSGVLSPPVLEGWSYTAVHQLAIISLPPTFMLRPSLASTNVTLSCVGGEVSAILDLERKSHLAFTVDFSRICLPAHPLKWYFCLV